MANHPPPRPINKWSPASLQHGTGYTAGLWELFHVMSVGLVQWNHMALEDDQKIIPAEMADILRDYVEHFFQCEVCRLNFLVEILTRTTDRPKIPLLSGADSNSNTSQSNTNPNTN